MPQLRLEVNEPHGSHSLPVSADTLTQRLTELLHRAHLPLNTRCGQRSLCDGCLIELLEGRLIRISDGQPVGANPDAITLRACEHRLDTQASVRIRIPSRSLLAHKPKVVSDFRINVPWAHDPIHPIDLTASAPTLGAAIDVGTTTVALLLIDLATGGTLATAADFNRQTHFGDDVVTRIDLCASDSSMIHKLRRAIGEQTISRLLTDALDSAHASLQQVTALVITGNTTMLHLLAGADPTPLGSVPFRPAFLDYRKESCRTLQLPLPDSSRSTQTRDPAVHLLPGASAYVGADIVAGVFASGLVYDEGPSLLVDVGTNGEIVLKHGTRMLGCATAAGPAFEGGSLTAGVRAGPGAVDEIRLDANPLSVRIHTINDAPPIGLCGSAYLDLLAEGRRIGLLSAAGRFKTDSMTGVAEHLTLHGRHRALRITQAEPDHNLLVTEVDLARLLQAKAAIAAGILTLLHETQLKPTDINTLYLAGGFGMHLNLDSAIACGLLPGFRREQIQIVGNTALAGAYLCLMDRNILDELTRIARSIEVIELNLTPGFESCFIDQLSLP